MTRDEARQHWAASGLTYEALTYRNLQLLRNMINKAMIKSEAISNSLRAKQRFNHRATERGSYHWLRCRAHYFENREAITFNPDGFVGFAGWADETNVQPILTAFCKWVDEVKGVSA